MSGGVPAGWVLVPVECTDDIAEAIAFEAHVCGGIAESTWRAALAAVPATPTPPIEGRDADVERVVKALEGMLIRHRNSVQNWTQAAVDAQRSDNRELSVQIQNIALTCLDGFPTQEARAALQALGERP